MKEKADIETRRKRFRSFCFALFVIYMVVIVYLLLLCDIYGRKVLADYTFNLKPFGEIKRFGALLWTGNFRRISVGLVNIGGNILAFVPFGALLRWAANRKIRWWYVLLQTFLFSFVIEVMQLITKVGVFDVDDLILNTLGGMLGFAIYHILRAIDIQIHKGKKEKQHGKG